MTSLTYLQPGLVALLIALGCAQYFGKRRLAAAAAILLFLWSWMPTAVLLSGALEWWYPIRPLPDGEAEAIVVLSGGLYKSDPTMPEDLPGPDTFLRVSYAAWLHHHWKPLPIVVSGGVTGKRRRVVLAEVMQRALVQQGVPPSMIWVEGRSQSTYENAAYSADILRAKGIRRVALVTEAYHMLRAEKAFRRQSLIVVPAPCAYYSVLFTWDFAQLIPAGRHLTRNELAIHELAGLLWYRLSGKL